MDERSFAFFYIYFATSLYLCTINLFNYYNIFCANAKLNTKIEDEKNSICEPAKISVNTVRPYTILFWHMCKYDKIIQHKISIYLIITKHIHTRITCPNYMWAKLCTVHIQDFWLTGKVLDLAGGEVQAVVRSYTRSLLCISNFYEGKIYSFFDVIYDVADIGHIYFIYAFTSLCIRIRNEAGIWNAWEYLSCSFVCGWMFSFWTDQKLIPHNDCAARTFIT